MHELALVGCPSAGKSTFFKAATLKDAKIAPYPFTTVQPDKGTAFVTTKCPCAEFGKSCNNCIEGTRFVPILLWDIVGLVPDAHKGRGRGIAFLDDIRQAQALLHIIDASGKTNLEGNPSEGFDPFLAVQMLEKEISWWLVNIFKKLHARKHAKEPFIMAVERQFSGLGISTDTIKKAAEISNLDEDGYMSWSDGQIFSFVNELRRLSKPSLIVANKADIPEAEENIRHMQEIEGSVVIPASADYELALREAAKAGIIKYLPGSPSFEILKENSLTAKQKSALKRISDFLREHKSTGVQPALNKAAFGLLNLIVVYPVADAHKLSDSKGRILPDAFLLRRGATAKDLAFAVHEDIGKKFISAIDARTGLALSSHEPLKDGSIVSIKAGR
ncbi:MAG: redox-regulated ATPase YchF [Candidatus Aenigmarchaeota archaeon]|nr:redox-regulated ATPase YchF [Candidatus Aenigmarchaeota archaeon]